MKKIIYFVVIFLLISLIVLAIRFLTHSYKIELIGKDSIVINVNSEYKDEGARVTDKGKIVKNYTTLNNVNTSEIGTYEVIYKIKNAEKRRIIKVVDNEKPVIKEKDKKYHIKGKKMDLSSLIEVTDNYDKNLIDKVKISDNFNPNKEGKYNVTYTVSDSSNNEAIIKSTIYVQDKDTNGIPVLMYHWFYDDTKGEKPGERNSHNFISKTEFEKQMKYLKESNFYYPTWQELIDYIDGKIDLPKKSIILTDDDCVQSFFDVALPVFQKYEVPFTSFCITKKGNWQKYVGEKYLTFESHTNNLHQRICKGSWDGAVMCKNYDTVYSDLKTSIEKVKNTDSFAYPFGHYNNNTIKALKENGIKLAFTISDGQVKKGANKYKLPRVRISSWTSLSTYKNLIK